MVNVDVIFSVTEATSVGFRDKPIPCKRIDLPVLSDAMMLERKSWKKSPEHSIIISLKSSALSLQSSTDWHIATPLLIKE